MKKIYFLLFPLLVFSSGIKSYYWKYNLDKDYYTLYIKFDGVSCLHKGDMLIFISPLGKVYKKVIKRETCFVKKYFKSLKSEKLLVLVFRNELFEIKKLGVLKTPLSSD